MRQKQQTFGRGFDIYIFNYASYNNDSFTELGHTYISVFTQFGSLRASSPGRSGGEAEKGRSQSARRACSQAIRPEFQVAVSTVRILMNLETQLL